MNCGRFLSREGGTYNALPATATNYMHLTYDSKCHLFYSTY